MEFNIEGYVASLGLKKSRGEQLVNYLKEQDKKSEEKEKRVRELEEALRECEEYFDNKSDVDHDGENYVPNKEAKLLSQITKLLYNH